MNVRTTCMCFAAAAALASPAASLAASKSPPDKRFTVVAARVVMTSGRRHLVLRVNGPARTVRVRVVLARTNERIITAAVRTVRTNRRVVVPRLVIPGTATRIHVRILGHIG